MTHQTTLLSRVVCATVFAVLSCQNLRAEVPAVDTGDCQGCAARKSDGLPTGQATLLGSKLDGILPGRTGRTDVYFLGFAGNGDQPVFANEVTLAATRIAELYGSSGRSLVLASNSRNTAVEPLANSGNLFQAIAGLGARMNVEEDILFLYLASHGWKNATLQVSLGELPLAQLRAEDLRAALDSAGIEWRIIVISACYSGSFIEALKTGRTVIMTAASASNPSYGCAPDNDLTDFGRALLVDAIGTRDGLLEDFRFARYAIARREDHSGRTPSKPQTYVGFEMEKKLEQLSASKAP